MRATCEEFPGLTNWTNWCYGEQSTLLYDHSEVIVSSAGVQQGDPLGPLYFCFALNALVAEIASLGPVYHRSGGVRARPPEGLGAVAGEGSGFGAASQPQ